MKKLFTSTLIIVLSSVTLYAENNESLKTDKINKDINKSKVEIISKEKNITKVEKIEKQLQEQMEREKKFAKEQTFYKGEEYDLSYAEIDKNSLDSVPLIEPDYDFNMDDVYD